LARNYGWLVPNDDCSDYVVSKESPETTKKERKKNEKKKEKDDNIIINTDSTILEADNSGKKIVTF